MVTPAPSTNSPKAPTASSELTPNIAGALAYLLGFISGIFFYLTSKDKFVRFHAIQSTIVSVGFVVVSMIVGSLPGIGYILSSLLSVGGLIVMLVLIVKAYQGTKYKLPVIGDIAEKNA